jgi:hypothetical protein
MRQHTPHHAARTVHLLLVDQSCEDETVETWPLGEWLQDGPNRFVHHQDGDPRAAVYCTVTFDDDYHAEVHLIDVGIDDLSIREIE